LTVLRHVDRNARSVALGQPVAPSPQDAAVIVEAFEPPSKQAAFIDRFGEMSVKLSKNVGKNLCCRIEIE
jgi:hypothetical protein